MIVAPSLAPTSDGHNNMKIRQITLFSALVSAASAAPVALQNATATYSQSSYSVATAIDGNADAATGWGVGGETGQNQTAAFELTAPLASSGGFDLTFTLAQNLFAAGHSIGRFRLSVTSDDVATFADGLSSGGDVTANWTVLTPYTVSASGGVTLTPLGDGSVLASGTLPATTTYVFSAITGITEITGVRLEVLADASLPSSGPGRATGNGNFVLSEFSMSAIALTAVPEPASFASFGGLVALTAAFVSRRRRRF